MLRRLEQGVESFLHLIDHLYCFVLPPSVFTCCRLCPPVCSAMSIFGGIAPLAMSSLGVVLQPATMAAGVVVVITALITFAAGVVLVKVVPGTNAPVPAGQHVAYLQQQEQQKREAQRPLQEVVVGEANSGAA